jgi:hypothetical protein
MFGMSMLHDKVVETHWEASIRRNALTYQISATIKVRECIDSGVVDGSEDWLLATVNCFAIFEVAANEGQELTSKARYHTDLPKYASAHIGAMIQLF